MLPGHTLTQEPHPVQSRVDTVIVNLNPGRPVASFALVASGAAASSASVMMTGRIAACGQT